MRRSLWAVLQLLLLLQAQSKTDRRSSRKDTSHRSHSTKARASSARHPSGSTTAALQQAIAAAASKPGGKAYRSRSSGKESSSRSSRENKSKPLAAHGEATAGGGGAVGAALADVTHERDELRERLAALESSLAKSKPRASSGSGRSSSRRCAPRNAPAHVLITSPSSARSYVQKSPVLQLSLPLSPLGVGAGGGEAADVGVCGGDGT